MSIGKLKTYIIRLEKEEKNGDSMKPMDQILGHKPAIQPPVIIESGNMAPTAVGGTDLSEEGDGLIEADGEESSNLRGNSSSCGSRSETPLAIKDAPAKTPFRKHKKKKSHNMEQMEELVVKFTRGE